MAARLLIGDCRSVMAGEGPFDLIIADQPYGDTSMPWDKHVDGWEAHAAIALKPTGSMWVFGSMRNFLLHGTPDGWRYCQDIVWEKPNGSGFAADRFKRVHEHVVQFRREGDAWGAIYNDVQRVPRTGPSKDGVLRVQLPHTGAIAPSVYRDDGMRIMRTVIKAPAVRGGPHKTAKPVELLEHLIRTSCPPGGVVGDFFAGSGSVGIAALRTGRRYVGCDLDHAMVAVATARLAEPA